MSIQPYLGVNVNAASVEELRYRGLLEEGEVLLALFDGILLDENRRRVGGLALTDFLALTDRRMITWARGFFNDTVDSFAWADVDVVDAETWDPWHGRVRLAFRLPAVAPRTRRIAVRGSTEAPGQEERVLLNTLDYVPVEDVTVLANMVAWIGDQIVQGVTGEPFVEAFAAEYPAVERQPPAPFFQVQPDLPPPPVEQPPVEQPKKRWWQWGKAEEAVPALEPPTTPGNLIAAYESRRQGVPVGSGPQAGPLPQSPLGPIPTLPEQPNMYEVSRSLRLVLEVPRRLARGMRRAGEMMGGASELVSGMQDPQVRRNAMRGIYRAAAQQEAENGPLAPVGPVVRAAVRFSEPLEQEQADPASRRIQVRSAVRRSSPEAPPAEPPAVRPISLASRAAPAADAPPAEPSAGPVRRSISVRRVESPQPAPDPAAPEPESAEPPRVPVRRIVINRSEPLQPATYTNGNGRHEEEL